MFDDPLHLDRCLQRFSSAVPSEFNITHTEPRTVPLPSFASYTAPPPSAGQRGASSSEKLSNPCSLPPKFHSDFSILRCFVFAKVGFLAFRLHLARFLRSFSSPSSLSEYSCSHATPPTIIDWRYAFVHYFWRPRGTTLVEGRNRSFNSSVPSFSPTQLFRF